MIRLALDILGDKDKRNKVLILTLSIVVGVSFLLFAPVAVLMTMGEIELPDVSGNFDQMESAGQQIASAMESAGVREQTVKAQLIYISCFEGVAVDDFNAYANLFKNAADDAALIDSINQTYGLDIVYEDFMQSYTWVMNTTINEYLFTDAATKNKPDLAAWARNAYVSGWAYRDGAIGEIDTELRYRCADNAGLILGYLRYNPMEKVFAAEPSTLYYTVKGNIDTMPDEEGVVLFDGTNFGVYVGNGEVIFSSADGGCVVKEPLGNRDWTSWCTFDAVTYPQEVTDAVDQSVTTEPTGEGA